jgi:serine/threonine-protein kinase
MGAVYAARHVLTGVEVALKLLYPDVGQDEAHLERFLREVRFAAEIGHPGIVRTLDAGEDADGTLYLAMELLRGEDLAAWLDRPSTTAEQAVDVILEVLEPLAAAHARGIVHRDLKPENVFIAREEDDRRVVKLLDFGIARQVGVSSKTTSGVGLGTTHYMAPEQAVSARDVRPAADVWAVGVMLYEAIAGVLPFDGESVHAVVLAACTAPHDPLPTHAPGVDRRLAALVDRCLAKRPDDRPADAGALRAELEALMHSQAVRASLRVGARGASGVVAAPRAAALVTAAPEAPCSDASAALGAPPRDRPTMDALAPPADARPVDVPDPAAERSNAAPPPASAAAPRRAEPQAVVVVTALVAGLGLAAAGVWALAGWGRGDGAEPPRALAAGSVVTGNAAPASVAARAPAEAPGRPADTAAAGDDGSDRTPEEGAAVTTSADALPSGLGAGPAGAARTAPQADAPAVTPGAAPGQRRAGMPAARPEPAEARGPTRDDSQTPRDGSRSGVASASVAPPAAAFVAAAPPTALPASAAPPTALPASAAPPAAAAPERAPAEPGSASARPSAPAGPGSADRAAIVVASPAGPALRTTAGPAAGPPTPAASTAASQAAAAPDTERIGRSIGPGPSASPPAPPRPPPPPARPAPAAPPFVTF